MKTKKTRMVGFLAILGLSVASTFSFADVMCSDINRTENPVSYFYLGCIGPDVQPREVVDELTGQFDDLAPSERLLLRTIVIVKGQQFPSRRELANYFGAVGEDLKLGDALTLTVLRRLSDLWSPTILSAYDNKANLTEATALALEAGILETVSWYGPADSEGVMEPVLADLDLQAYIGRLESSNIPWASAMLSSIYFDGRVSPSDHAEAFRLVQDIAGYQVTAGARLHEVVAYDESTWIDKVDRKIVMAIGELAKSGVLRSIGDLGAFTQFDVFSGNTTQYPSYVAALQRASRYGDPAAQFEQGQLLRWGERGFQPDPMRAYKLFEKASNWGLGVASDLLIQQDMLSREYEDAFFRALTNSAEGWVTFMNFGYQMAYTLAELAFDDPVAERWQDYLVASCNVAPFKHADTSACPQPRTTRKYVPRFGVELAEATYDDIQIAGRFQLETGQYKALLIGNAEYDAWSTLNTPHKDVDALQRLLEEDYDFEVATLKDASRREILKAIYDLGASSQFDDHVLVYYAGHGVVDRMSDVAYWIPSDAGRDFVPDWVSADEVLNAFKSVPAKHLLLVADSCYSGKLLRGDAPTVATPTESVVKRLFQKKARVALTSGGEEPVSDGSANSAHSVFAAALLAYLEANQSPLPASTLYEGILANVSREASQTPQYADMRELGHDGGDFIFVPGHWRE